MITRLPIAAGGKRNDDGFLSVSGDCCGGDDMHKINHDGMKIIGQANETEIAAAEQLVNDCVYRELRENEYAALVSFALTVRKCDFIRSKLVKLVNDGKIIPAAQEFKTWVMQGKRVSKALQKRREKEKSLFLKPEVVVNNMREKT